MKNGKEITSAKLTVDYIISFFLWGLIFNLSVDPLLTVIFSNILGAIFGQIVVTLDNFSSVETGILICGAIFSILIAVIINILVNIISTKSSLRKVDSLDSTKANKYLKNVTIFIIVGQIIVEILSFTILENKSLYSYIVTNIALIISLFFIRKHIKNRTKILVDKALK